jgi:hypothetical protein
MLGLVGGRFVGPLITMAPAPRRGRALVVAADVGRGLSYSSNQIARPCIAGWRPQLLPVAFDSRLIHLADHLAQSFDFFLIGVLLQFRVIEDLRTSSNR